MNELTEGYFKRFPRSYDAPWPCEQYKVDDQKLRFDFSHSKALTAKELKQVEAIVQEAIAAESPVYSLPVPLEQAKAISGLRSVFGEVRGGKEACLQKNKNDFCDRSSDRLTDRFPYSPTNHLSIHP